MNMDKKLQKEERIKIQTLLDVSKSITDISVYLKRQRSTIYREMNRPGIQEERYSTESYHLRSRANMIRNQGDTGPLR